MAGRLLSQCFLFLVIWINDTIAKRNDTFVLDMDGFSEAYVKNINDSMKMYYFVDKESITLTCHLSTNDRTATLELYKNEILIRNSAASKLVNTFKLIEADDNSNITCRAVSNNNRKEKNVILKYRKSTSPPPNTESPKTTTHITDIKTIFVNDKGPVNNKQFIVFCVLLSILIILVCVLIVCLINRLIKNKFKNKNQRLLESKSSDDVSRNDTIIPASLQVTYAAPRDEVGEKYINVNIKLEETYSSPYIARPVYAQPIPKSLRKKIPNQTVGPYTNVPNIRDYSNVITDEHGYQNGQKDYENGQSSMTVGDTYEYADARNILQEFLSAKRQ